MELGSFSKEYFSELSGVLNALDTAKLDALAGVLYSAYRQGRSIFVLGNGGSAACATHWVCDFNKGINVPGCPRAKVVSLSDNTGIVTALGNDISYDEIFSYQLENFCHPGDVVLALSVSGNSPNLVNGLAFAAGVGCTTAAIIGGYDGKLGSMADICLVVPSRNYGVVEDVHLILNHVLSQYFRRRNQEAAG